MVAGQPAAPQIGETERQTKRFTTWIRNPQAETSVGTSAQAGKPELQLANGWRLGVDKRETKTTGGPGHRGAPGAQPGSHSEDQRKVPLCFQRGEGKESS